MTVINVASPYAFKRATLTIEADDFTAHVSQAELQPSGSSGSWTGIGGNVIQDQGATTWALALGLVQDDSTTGLLRYLFANDGQTKTVKLRPRGATTGGTEWTVTVVLAPATIGGSAGNTPLSSSVTLPVVGKPVPTLIP